MRNLLCHSRRLAILLTSIALLLYAYSLFQINFDIDSFDVVFGLAKILPISFWISLVLLTTSFILLLYSSSKSWGLLFLQWFILILALWLTPFIVGGVSGSQPALSVAYNHFGATDIITRHGVFDTSLSWYLNWPGGMILGSMIVQLLHIKNPDILIALTPFILQLLYFPIIYVMIKTIVPKDSNVTLLSWGGIWIFSLANWSLQSYYSSQAIAFILLLTLVFCLLKVILSRNLHNFELICMVLIGSLAITHLITAITGLVFIAGLYITKNTRSAILPLLLIGAGISITWVTYITTTYFDANLAPLLESAFKPFDLLDSVSATGGNGSSSYQFASSIRVVSILYFFAIAVLGGIYGYRNRGKFIREEKIVIWFVIASGIVCASIGMGYGSGELLARFALFSLPAVAYFATKLLNTKITGAFLTILLLIAIPLHITAHYNRMAETYVSPSTIEGRQFFTTHTTDNGESKPYVVVSHNYSTYNNQEDYHFIHLSLQKNYEMAEDEGITQMVSSYLNFTNNAYVLISQSDMVFFEHQQSNSEFINRAIRDLEIDYNFVQFYSTGVDSYYYAHGQVTIGD